MTLPAMDPVALVGLRTVIAPRLEGRDDRAPVAVIDATLSDQLASLDAELTEAVRKIQRITAAQARLRACKAALMGATTPDDTTETGGSI